MKFREFKIYFKINLLKFSLNFLKKFEVASVTLISVFNYFRPRISSDRLELNTKIVELFKGYRLVCN